VSATRERFISSMKTAQSLRRLPRYLIR